MSVDFNPSHRDSWKIKENYQRDEFFLFVQDDSLFYFSELPVGILLIVEGRSTCFDSSLSIKINVTKSNENKWKKRERKCQFNIIHFIRKLCDKETERLREENNINM